MDPSAASFSKETPPSSPLIEHLAAATAAPFPYTPPEYDFQARPRRSGDYSVSRNMRGHSKRRREGNYRSQEASGATVEHDTLKSRLSRATLTAGEDKTSNTKIETAENLLHNALDPLNTRSGLAIWEANDDTWNPTSFRTDPQHSAPAKSVTRDSIKVASEELDMIDGEYTLLPTTTWKEWTARRDGDTSSNVRPPNKPSGGDDSIGRLHKTENVQKSSLQSMSFVKRPCRFVKGTGGHVEKLDPSYTTRRHDYQKFFQVGRVFSTLWTDGSSPSHEDDSGFESEVFYLEKVHCKIRRFVVLWPGKRFFTCLPITSYAGQGVLKRSIRLNEHGFIYCQKEPKEVDQMSLMPLKLLPSKTGGKLQEHSLVNYGRVYKVETNVKVRDNGVLDKDSKGILFHNYRKFWFGEVSDPSDFTSRRLDDFLNDNGGPVSIYPRQLGDECCFSKSGSEQDIDHQTPGTAVHQTLIQRQTSSKSRPLDLPRQRLSIHWDDESDFEANESEDSLILRSNSSRRKRETEKLKFELNPANGGHGMEEVVEEEYYDWVWACCNCGKLEAMTVDATPACPECGVFRCGNCLIELVKRRNLAHAITNGTTRSRVHRSASLEDLQPTTESHQTTLQEVHQGTSSIVQKALSWLGLKQDPNVSFSLPPKISSPVGPLNVALVASNAAPSWAPGVGTGLAAGTLVSGVLGTTVHNCYSFRVEEKRKCEEIERKRRDSDAASKAANRPLRWEYSGNPDDALICRHGPLRHSKNRGMILPNEARRAMFQKKRRKLATSRHLSKTDPSHVYESDSVSESSSDGEPSEGETSGAPSVLQFDGEIFGGETSGAISALQQQRIPSPPVSLKGSESTADSCHATTQESASGVVLVTLDGDCNQLQHMSNQTSLTLSPSSTSVKSSSDYTQEEHVQPSPLSYQMRPFSASLRINIPPFPDDSQEREKWYKFCKYALWEAFIYEKDRSESVWKLLGHEMLDPYIGHVLNPVPPGYQDQVNWLNFYLLILRGVKGGFVSFEEVSWEF